MRRRKRLSLTAEGGILFGILMLVAVIALVVTLFSLPSEEELPAESGKVWAEVLTNADFARLNAPADREAEAE